MDALWFLLALWIGFFAGFLVCALMTMARDKASEEPVGYLQLKAPRVPT